MVQQGEVGPVRGYRINGAIRRPRGEQGAVEGMKGYHVVPTGAGEGDDRGPDPDKPLPDVQGVLGDPGKGNDYGQ